MRGIIITFLSCILFFSCQEKKEEKGYEVSEQVSKVWELHDEIMPRVGELRSLKKQLTVIEDSLGSKVEFTDAKEQLSLADKDMHRWMKEFDMVQKDDKSYMDDQVVQLNKMKELFESSITNAKKIITDNK